MLGAAQAMSLFAERQLIEIRIPTGKPGKDGSEALQRYASACPTTCVTLVQLPRLDGQQLKSAWFAALDHAGVMMRVEPVERKRAAGVDRAAPGAQGQRVRTATKASSTLAFFADRVEGNLLAAHQEIQKLALLHPPGELSFEQIEAAVLNVARYDVFKLGEAVLAGQVARALRMLDGLQAEGEAAVLVHWTLAEDIRALKRVKDAMAEGKPLPMALREARVWGAKERLFERVLPLLADHQLAQLVEAAQRLRRRGQGPEAPATGRSTPGTALKRLMLLMMQQVARRRAPAPRAGAPTARLQLALRALVSSRARGRPGGPAARRRAAPADWPPPPAPRCAGRSARPHAAAPSPAGGARTGARPAAARCGTRRAPRAADGRCRARPAGRHRPHARRAPG